jgi:hypothetical protein
MLHDQEAVAVILRDGHELEGCEGAAHLKRAKAAIQPGEDAGVVAGDEEDLVALQIDVAVEGIYQHLHRGDEDVECLFEQRDAGVQFDLI